LQAAIISVDDGVCQKYAEEKDQDFGLKRPELGQDHAHVVAAAAQDGMERITERTFQAAAGETAVSFLMALIMC
jgi:hypothetical protein